MSDKDYKIEMVLHSANLQEAGAVEALIYALIDKHPDLELVRFSPSKSRAVPADGKTS